MEKVEDVMIDKDIEELIDTAGRGAVFAAAKELGWQSWDAPPKWVWRNIAHEIIGRRTEKQTPGESG